MVISGRIIRLILLPVAVYLTACTAQLREATFLAQSEDIEAIDQSTLHAWQQKFPDKELTKISLKAAELQTSEKALVEKAGESTILNGLYLDNPHSTELIFFIQGNGMKISTGGINAIEQLASLGKDIVVFDHRGLGTSSGHATIAALESDALLEFNYIKDELNPSKIYLHGYSLGSFIATKIAEKTQIDALVLQGSATNVDDWIDEITPWYTRPFLTIEIDPAFHTVDNKKTLQANYTGPLLIIAGQDDKQAPPELSQQLFEASNSVNKQLIIVKDAGHSGMLKEPSTMQDYLAFINSI